MCKVKKCPEVLKLESSLAAKQMNITALVSDCNEKLEKISRQEQELQAYERQLEGYRGDIELLQRELGLLRWKVQEATRVLGQTPRDSMEACDGLCADYCNEETPHHRGFPGWTPPA